MTAHQMTTGHEGSGRSNKGTHLVSFLGAADQVLEEVSAGTLADENEVSAAVAKVSRGGGATLTEATPTTHEERVDGEEPTPDHLPVPRRRGTVVGDVHVDRSCDQNAKSGLNINTMVIFIQCYIHNLCKRLYNKKISKAILNMLLKL